MFLTWWSWMVRWMSCRSLWEACRSSNPSGRCWCRASCSSTSLTTAVPSEMPVTTISTHFILEKKKIILLFLFFIIISLSMPVTTISTHFIRGGKNESEFFQCKINFLYISISLCRQEKEPRALLFNGNYFKQLNI